MKKSDQTLAPRALTCSINGAENSRVVEMILKEIAECKEKSVLREIIKLSLMDERFLETAKTSLFFLSFSDLAKGEFVEVKYEVKIPSKLFPEIILQELKSRKTMNFGGMTFVEKGKFIIFFSKDNVPAGEIVKMIPPTKFPFGTSGLN